MFVEHTTGDDERQDDEGPCRITNQLSNPNAELIKGVSVASAITVGSHLLSLVSVNKKTTSLSSIKLCRRSTSLRTASVSPLPSLPFPNECPGIGIVSTTPADLTSVPAIATKLSAAATALYLPPSLQSSTPNKL